MASKTVKQQAARRRAWIYVRYLFPVAAILLILIALLIPCLRYTTAETGTNPTISEAELLYNSWGQVREYLFGSSERSEGNTVFSQTVLVMLILSVLLFVVGAVTAVWTAVGAFRYFANPRERGTGRILFVTLFPNRVVVGILEAMILPLLAFPRLLVLCYERILQYHVLLNVTFVEPLVIGGILFVGMIALSVLTAPMERAAGMNPFPTRQRRRGVGFSRTEDEWESREAREEQASAPVFKTEAERRYYELSERTKAEQAERIRQLLRTDDGKDD